MSKVIDETGNCYGKLTVIERNGSISGKAAWKCQCECGNIITTTGDNLRRGNTTSCGCQAVERMRNVGINNSKDITGVRQGKLVALRKIGSTNYGGSLWECQCDCGNKHNVEYSNFINGKVQSCGCLVSKGEQQLQNLLNRYNVNYKTQFTPIGWKLSTGYKPFYDVALFKDNQLICLIEYHGEQHRKYYNNKNTWNNYDNFEKTQRRDKEKCNLCETNNIPLYIIWYDDDINENLLNILHNENFDI